MKANEYVRTLYRILLTREPESDEVVSRLARLGSEADILRCFLTSDEFKSRRLLPKPIGSYLDSSGLPIEDTATADQLQLILEGIMKKWQLFGDTEPHWSVLTHHTFLAKNIKQNIDGFYASGHVNINNAFSAIKRSGGDPNQIRKCIDFGCGVGRLTLPLARHAQSVLGVDVSPGHLKVAKERCQVTGIENISFALLSSLDDIPALPMVDFIISLIVLQHNPPPVINKILSLLLGLLNPGGFCYIQIPTFIEGYSFDINNYINGAKQDMEMNCVPQSAIFRIIHEQGCAALEVREDDWAGSSKIISNTFLVGKR